MENTGYWVLAKKKIYIYIQIYSETRPVQMPLRWAMGDGWGC